MRDGSECDTKATVAEGKAEATNARGKITCTRHSKESASRRRRECVDASCVTNRGRVARSEEHKKRGRDSCDKGAKKRDLALSGVAQSDG